MLNLISNIMLLTVGLMFTIGLLKFATSWGHLLVTLIMLEFIALSLFLGLVIFTPMVFEDNFSVLFYLSIAVCEGALGLSILVLYARHKGSDQLNTKTFLKW
uniref:NADH-ubiquinone oxidoreductase chain 4L n=1 Tax=Sphaeroma terebrans TaxID=180402 RepID=A0A5J6NJ85_SPHTE|nr:NADH dehydrogenase subunit 4L [Sphaeroma terebrans]